MGQPPNEKLKEKGLKTAIVSSHPRANLNDELRRYGIFQLFDEISGDPSPKTQRLLQICQRFSVAPENTFFVEDTTYGLKSGKDAGLVCFGITTGYHTREKLEAEGNAVAVVDSLTQLLELVI